MWRFSGGSEPEPLGGTPAQLQGALLSLVPGRNKRDPSEREAGPALPPATSDSLPAEAAQPL